MALRAQTSKCLEPRPEQNSGMNGNRIRQVRELCGWTQEVLAEKLNIKQPSLAQAEANQTNLSETHIQTLSDRTGFGPLYFDMPDMVDFPMGSLLFRAHASISSAQRTEAYRHAQLLFEIWETLGDHVNELPIRVPRLKEQPALAAQVTRAELGLSPDTPIPNLVRTIEKNGVVVLAVPVNLEKRDAFSLWAGSESRKPVVAIAAGRPGDRVYWSTAHELGHLVMHHPLRMGIDDIERQADLFAAELLLPEAAMRREIIPPVTLDSIAKLKLRWRVAMQAIIRRAHELEIIQDRQYRYLFEQIAWRGWRIKEPSSLAITAEKPRALRERTELLYGKQINYAKLSENTNIGVDRLKKILRPMQETRRQQAFRTEDFKWWLGILVNFRGREPVLIGVLLTPTACRSSTLPLPFDSLRYFLFRDHCTTRGKVSAQF